MPQESARLLLGDLICLSDDLCHRNVEIRSEGKHVIQKALSALETLMIGAKEKHSNIRPTPYRLFKREIELEWLRVDQVVDELLNRAANEISQFAAETERRIIHELARAQFACAVNE